MKTFIFSTALTITTVFSAPAFAHDIHQQASDHYHPGNLYTHSVSSAYDHNKAHQYNTNYAHRNGSNAYSYNYNRPKVTTNTATYYTRHYPVKQTYTYLTTPNTTIHQPPYAYSSCANQCSQAPKRITVSRNLGGQNLTYPAPSEYSAQTNLVVTPNRYYRSYQEPQTTTHVSPYKTHKLTTRTYYNGY